MTVSDRPLPIVNDASSGSLKEHLDAAIQRLRPREARIVTAYLTPDGFLSLKDGLSAMERVRVLLGERPFLNRRGPKDILTQPSEVDELRGPAEPIDWYTFLEGGRFLWTGPSDLTVPRMLAGASGEPAALEEAADFLREMLADGPLTATEVVRAARNAGIAERTLRRAKATLEVRSEPVREPGKPGIRGWGWALPSGAGGTFQNLKSSAHSTRKAARGPVPAGGAAAYPPAADTHRVAFPFSFRWPPPV